MLQPVFELRRYRREMVNHAHDFHQIVMPLHGHMVMLVDGVEGRVSDGGVAVVASGRAHGFMGSESNAFLVLDIPETSQPASEATAAVLWRYARAHPFVPASAGLRQLIEYLADMTLKGRLRAPLSVHACALLLGAITAELNLDDEHGIPAALRAVSGYIDAHLEWPLQVVDMARAASLSESRLHVLFRTHLQTTPMRYLARRRMHRASELLAHSTLPLSEVALRTGFADHAAFTRAFRKHLGQTPSTYRASARAQ